MIHGHCARCRRPLSREPIVIEGKGYGSTCATKVGDLLVQPQRREHGTGGRRARRVDARQLPLEA